MKDKDLFGILEDAENDSMERLIDKCPEISDEQLDKILEMSERKFNMKKNEKAVNSNITMTENIKAEGTERRRRSAWRGPASMAASLILIAGIAIGSTALIRKGSKKPGDESVVNPGAVVTDTATVPTTEITTDTYSYLDPESTDITPFVGKWRYIVSQTNNVSADGIETAIVEIRENGVYEYTGNDGSFSEGTVKLNFEEIGGTKVARLEFTGGTPFEAANYYDDGSHKELHLGNGDSARMIRIPDLKDITNYTGKWRYQTAENGDFSNEPVDVQGTVEIKDDKTYTYTALDGTVKNGTVNIRTKEHSDALWLDFTDNISGERNTFFFDVTFPNMFFNGNGGRIVKVQEVTIDVKDFAGEWTYQGAAGRYTVDVKSVDLGTMVINADSTFDFSDNSGNHSRGVIKVEYETCYDGSENTMLCFYEDGVDRSIAAYYNADDLNVLSVGNGGMAQFIRNQKPVDPQMKAIAGEWRWVDADENGQPVHSEEFKATVMIRENGTFAYYGDNGEEYEGAVVRSTETIADQTFDTVNFYEADDTKFEKLKFGGYYHKGTPSYISIGNGGLSVLYDVSEANW